MAFYRDKKNVKQATEATEQRYSKEWKPGDKPIHAGIYKCQVCGFEDVINRQCETMPPCAECREDTKTWKLLVRAEDE